MEGVASLPTEVAMPTQPLSGGSRGRGIAEHVPVIKYESPGILPRAVPSGGVAAALDAEQLARKLRNHEAITSSQIRNLEATVEQHKLSLTELRREIAAQQEHRVEAALSKLTQSRGPGTSDVNSDSQLPSTGTGETASSLGSSSYAELQREINDLRDALQMQASAAEVVHGSMRKELVSQLGDEMRNMQELVSRSAAEFARRIQNVKGIVETSADTLRAEFRRDLDRVRSDLETPDKSQPPLAVARRSISIVGEADHTRASHWNEPDKSNGANSSVMPGGGAGSDNSGGDAADLAKLRQTVQELSSRLDGTSQNVVALGWDLSDFRERTAAEFNQQRTRADTLESTMIDVAARATLAAGTANNTSRAVPRPGNTDADRAREVEIAQTKVTDEFLGRMQRSIGALSSSMDEVRGSMGRLGEDIQRERQERCSTLADVSCRADAAADMAKKAMEELRSRHQRYPASPRARLGSEDAAGSEVDSVAEGAARRAAMPPEGGQTPAWKHEGLSGLAGLFSNGAVKREDLQEAAGTRKRTQSDNHYIGQSNDEDWTAQEKKDKDRKRDGADLEDWEFGLEAIGTVRCSLCGERLPMDPGAMEAHERKCSKACSRTSLDAKREAEAAQERHARAGSRRSSCATLVIREADEAGGAEAAQAEAAQAHELMHVVSCSVEDW